MRNSSPFGILTLLGATAFGTLIGVGVGLMMATKPGEELREDIAATGKDLYRKARKKKRDLEDDFDDFAYEFEDDEIDDDEKETDEKDK